MKLRIRWIDAKTAAALALIAASVLAADAAFAQDKRPAGMTTASRPFAIVEVLVGDVPFAIPNDWVTSGFVSIHRSDRPFVHFANLHQRPAPTTHFEVPRLVSLSLRSPVSGVAEQNLRVQKELIERRWSKRKPDEDGFWQWKLQEYLLVDRHHPRPLDQPLIINCFGSARPKRPVPEQRCGASFYWTLNVSVRYDIYDTEIPKRQWVELDKRVIDLVTFLDGRGALTDRR